MAFPVIPIISAVTPIVLGAIDLYRRRSEAQATEGATGMAEGVTDAHLPRRLRALEQSDLEQARLLTDLSKQVEQLAQVVSAQGEEQRQMIRQLRRGLWLALGCAVIATLAAIGAWVR